jgi:hypothetical protein
LVGTVAFDGPSISEFTDNSFPVFAGRHCRPNKVVAVSTVDPLSESDFVSYNGFGSIKSLRR